LDVLTELAIDDEIARRQVRLRPTGQRPVAMPSDAGSTWRSAIRNLTYSKGGSYQADEGQQAVAKLYGPSSVFLGHQQLQERDVCFSGWGTTFASRPSHRRNPPAEP
jgi:hypothetical protein